MNWLLEQSKEEAERILVSSGDRGTRVHMAVRELLEGHEVKIDQQYPSDLQKGRFEKLTVKEWNCIRGFANFIEMYKPVVHAQEVTVFSPEYAGTIDFLGTIEVPKIGRIPVLLDHKTSSGIWNEYKLQVAAYFVLWNAKQDPFMADYTAIARYGTKHKAKFELQIFDTKQTIENFGRFHDVLNLHKFSNLGYDKPEIEDLPASFKFEIPKWVPENKGITMKSAKKGKRKVVRGRRLVIKNKKNVGKTNERGSN